MKQIFELELVQKQRLTLTPELHQAIMILQMNTYELCNLLVEEAEKNPLIELENVMEEELQEHVFEDEEDWVAYFSDSSDLGINCRASGNVNRSRQNEPSFTDYTHFQPNYSIRKHLLFQLGELQISDSEFRIAEFIIGNIDNNGYLKSSISQIASDTSNTESKVESVLNIIQTFEPPGVAARDLRECLELQAKAQSFDDLALCIIRNHLDDLGHARYAKIAKDCHVAVEQVLRMRDAITSLDPKPGSVFSGGHTAFVKADIIVKKIGEELVIYLNENILPVIRWNPYYRRLLSVGQTEAKNYLLQQLKKARFLLKSIEQRRTTITNVMKSIVSRQKRFFLEGPGHLEPLILQDVADELGIHSSTVSRAVSDKYVDTPFGVFPCKMFFTLGIESDGQTISRYNVKEMIRQIVDDEDPREPLTDNQIVEKLEQHQIKIARRTVAKYRSVLGIPAFNRRKKL